MSATATASSRCGSATWCWSSRLARNPDHDFSRPDRHNALLGWSATDQPEERGMGVGDPLDVAGELIDPEHRLPGELDSETSPLLEDAQHWLQVYAELLAFKRTLLRTAEVHKERA